MGGQTVRARMEGVMKDNRIDFGAFRAGDIQGNGYRKLIICRGEITKYMTEFLQSIPEGQKNYSDEEIGVLFGVYARLLGHLEAFFSIIFKKWFHLNDSDADKAILHRDATENLWRYLKISATPKLHLLFVHLLRFLQRVQGFGYLGENSGKQAHQEEARNESQVDTVLNLAKKERSKSQFEAMKKSAMIKETMSEFKQKSKRNFIIDDPSQVENNGTKRKRLREEQKYELLLRPLLDGTRIFPSDIKRQKIMND